MNNLFVFIKHFNNIRNFHIISNEPPPIMNNLFAFIKHFNNIRNFQIISNEPPPIMNNLFAFIKHFNNIRNFQIISNENEKNSKMTTTELYKYLSAWRIDYASHSGNLKV